MRKQDRHSTSKATNSNCHNKGGIYKSLCTNFELPCLLLFIKSTNFPPLVPKSFVSYSSSVSVSLLLLAEYVQTLSALSCTKQRKRQIQVSLNEKNLECGTIGKSFSLLSLSMSYLFHCLNLPLII